MQFEMKRMTAVCVTALAVAGCGGGGGSNTASGGGTTAKTLTLSGTAATGLAMSGGAVVVKCSSGTGTATTGASGSYTVSITDGVLPCMIEVSGTVDGTEIKLHSITEAGTASGNNIAAIANVTPLTELIVAKLAAAIPSDLFASFNSGTQISSADLTAATTAVVTALKEATGIDLGSIDPFKTTLVAATASAPNAGNDYDKALDALKEKVSIETLPQVVAQVAASATSSATDSDTVTLKDVMNGVSSGALEGCPSALSGKYRTIDYFGRTRVAYLDFNKDNAGWFSPDKATKIFPITKSSTDACRFTAAGPNTAGENVTYDIVIGRSGVGAYTARNTTRNTATVGYIFPVQAHALANVEGEWNFVQSGVSPLENSPGEFDHFYGKLGLNAAGSVAICEYAPDGSCAPDDEAPTSIVGRTDGGFNLTDGTFTVPVYAYKAPNGSVVLFGTTNPEGATDASVERSVIVATRVQTLSLPAVSTTESKYWDLTQIRRTLVQSTPPTVNVTENIGSDGTTVIETLSANSFKRRRTSDGREDILAINSPFNGWRSRAPASGAAGMNQLMVNGLGLSVATNSGPTSPTDGYQGHFYVISVVRP